MPPNDVHTAPQAPARLVKHDGAIFVTDDKGMHLLRSLELLQPEVPSVAGFLAHEPMLGFDIEPKQAGGRAHQVRAQPSARNLRVRAQQFSV